MPGARSSHGDAWDVGVTDGKRGAVASLSDVVLRSSGAAGAGALIFISLASRAGGSFNGEPAAGASFAAGVAEFVTAGVDADLVGPVMTGAFGVTTGVETVGTAGVTDGSAVADGAGAFAGRKASTGATVSVEVGAGVGVGTVGAGVAAGVVVATAAAGGRSRLR